METLRARIREARVALGLSIWEAAERADVSRHYWQYLEWGRRTMPSPEELRKVLSAVELDAGPVLEELGYLRSA